jgi:5-methylcytosine-specific restriction endonuclease McrA
MRKSVKPMPGEELRSLILKLSSESKNPNTSSQSKAIVALVQLFLPEQEAQESVFDLLIDYVFNLTLSMAKSALNPSSTGHPDKICYEAIFQAFGLEKIDAEHLSRAAMRTAREAEEKRDDISKSQSVNEDYCYLCGEVFLQSDEGKTTVDHVLPKRAGGTKKKNNMFRCHNRCEIPKWDTVGAGDVASLRFAFGTPNPLLVGPVKKDWVEGPVNSKSAFLSLIRNLRFAQLRVGIAARQQYKCVRCEKSFLDETRGFILIRRETRSPWAYTNMLAICHSCNPRQ